MCLTNKMGKLRNRSCWSVLFIYMRYIFIICYPIILSPILILHPGPESKAAYILLLMSGFWITEVIPLYMTALLPLVLAPLMGLVPSAVIAKEYSSNSIFLFLGGMLMAIAAENVNLHLRIAVAFMRWMGHDARLLMLSVMLPTWFLSMWMSNTATSVMMITVVEALLSKLGAVTNAESDATTLNEETGTESNKQKQLRRFATGLSLSICYAASCGGIATLIGSPPNIIFYGLAVSRYGTDIPLNFGSWVAFGFPISLLCLITTWLTLCAIFLGPKECFRCRRRKRKPLSESSIPAVFSATDVITDTTEAVEGSVTLNEHEDTTLEIANIVKKIAEEEQQLLGRMKFGEKACIILFLLLIGVWVTREPGVPGWSRFMPLGNNSKGGEVRYVGDTQPTLLFAFLAFIIPASNPFRLRVDKDETDKQARKRINRGILTWELAQSRTSWGVLLLMGGGFALSEIVTVGGLSKLICHALEVFRSVQPFGLVCIFTLVSAILTEVVSNAATVTILVPMMFDLAQSINVHPFLLSLPLTMSISLAFMLPAATPPNAIVYAKGRVRLLEMVKTGITLNILARIILILCTMSYGMVMFHMEHFPDWAENK